MTLAAVAAVAAVAVPVAPSAVAGGGVSGGGGEGGGSEGSGSEGDWGRKRPQTCTRPHVVPIMLANQPTERPAPTAFLKTMSLSAAQSSAPSAKTMPASMVAATHLPGRRAGGVEINNQVCGPQPHAFTPRRQLAPRWGQS